MYADTYPTASLHDVGLLARRIFVCVQSQFMMSESQTKMKQVGESWLFDEHWIRSHSKTSPKYAWWVRPPTTIWTLCDLSYFTFHFLGYPYDVYSQMHLQPLPIFSNEKRCAIGSYELMCLFTSPFLRNPVLECQEDTFNSDIQWWAPILDGLLYLMGSYIRCEAYHRPQLGVDSGSIRI